MIFSLEYIRFKWSILVTEIEIHTNWKKKKFIQYVLFAPISNITFPFSKYIYIFGSLFSTVTYKILSVSFISTHTNNKCISSLLCNKLARWMKLLNLKVFKSPILTKHSMATACLLSYL